jgi:excisionase family DNA binding protein
VDQINGSVVFFGGCPGDCPGCASMRRLLNLAGRLRAQGLDARFGAFDDTATGRHFDSVTITNPRQPHRGSFHVDGDGWTSWDYPLTALDEHAIGPLAEQIANVLRVNGLPRRVRPPDSMSQNQAATIADPARPSPGQPPNDGRLLTIAEVAALARLSGMSVYRAVHCGELTSIRLGRSFRIPHSAAQAWIGVPLNPDLTSKLAQRPAIGLLLKNARHAAGLTQAQLASKMGIHPNLISKAERHGHASPLLWETADRVLGMNGKLATLAQHPPQ